jgi:hypothetical protein
MEERKQLAGEGVLDPLLKALEGEAVAWGMWVATKARQE